MSKVTSQEVIDKGEYLEPGFEPSTLLVVHLRAILSNHDVKYAANATKPQLVKLFNDYIAPNAGVYRKMRRDNATIKSDASDILDGTTGEYLEPQPIKRRLSRKSTAETPKRVPSASPTRKARRPIATPRGSIQPVKNEDEVATSDDERMAASTPVMTDDGRKGRRVSQKWGTGDERSAWEDNNPFQQATLSTPDLRSSASKSTKRGRHSDFASHAVENNIFPTPGSLKLPTFPTSSSRKSYPFSSPIRTPAKYEMSSSPQPNHEDETFDDGDDQHGYSYVEGDSQNDIIRQKIASLGEDVANGTLARRAPASGMPTWIQVKTPTPIVLQHLDEIQAAEDCRAAIVRRADAGLPPDTNSESCKMSLIPRATQCTPCPPHARCQIHSITCDPAYTLRPNSFSSIPFADIILNGMPGLGSVAFPPRCVADVRRRQNVGKMARAIENKLASVRGDRICAGIQSPGGDAQDAAAFGISVDEIKTSLTNRIPKGIHRIDEIFNQAIVELKDSKLLVSVRDITGKEVLASIREELSYVCKAKLFALKTWTAWRNSVIASAFVIVLIMAARSKQAGNIREGRRVKTIVQEALERVKEQEARHYLDPAGYPSANLSSHQLRDEIMQDEHSIATRMRIWDRVEKIVEGNSNVRSNMEVTATGDEGRVWTWVGASGRRGINGTGKQLM